MKKGSQHTTNAPVIIARVLAAFFSLFASRSLTLSLFGGWLGFGAGAGTREADEFFAVETDGLDGSEG